MYPNQTITQHSNLISLIFREPYIRVYKDFIHKQNVLINDNSIIPVYDIEEIDVGKFQQLLKINMHSMYQTNKRIENKREILLNYKQATVEVKDMIKYIHSDRVERETLSRPLVPILHTNLSTYTQTLVNFHDTNPVPDS